MIEILLINIVKDKISIKTYNFKDAPIKVDDMQGLEAVRKEYMEKYSGVVNVNLTFIDKTC